MKTLFLVFVLFLSFFPLAFCQQEVSIATYKMGVYGERVNLDTFSNVDKKILSTIAKVQEVSQNIEFQLIFNPYSSVFKLKEAIIPEGEEAYYRIASIRGASPGTIFYKNNKDRKKIKQTESTGESFLVEYPYQQFEWNITNDTKIIHGYKCYKATTHWEEFDYSRNLLLISDPIVWFTNEIPFPFGPKGLDGLPGLVLEGTFNGKTFFYVTEIKTGVVVKDKVMEEPAKGKKIMLEEYLKLLGEKYPRRR